MSKKETTNIELIVSATEIQTKDGKKFIAYEGYTKSNQRCKFKFLKALEDVIPKVEGVYVMTIPATQIAKDSQARWLTYWIREIIECRPYKRAEDTECTDF